MSDLPANSPPARTTTRLHISPLSEDLLRSYLTPDQRSKALNISLHTLQAFPEKGYGFVELPTEDAVKIMKKLNGSILKGQKIKIEEAKPERRKAVLENSMGSREDNVLEDPRARKPKRQKSKQGVLEGVELHDDRKVMRGWTESVAEKKEKRKKQKDGKGKVRPADLGEEGSSKKEKKAKKEKSREMSKFTSEPELLFKTKLPPNVAASVPKPTQEGKEKSKKRKRAGDERDVVVHEFAKTKKHASFLKSSSSVVDGATSDHYVDGKGWVDSAGEVLEPEPETVKKSKKRKEKADKAREEAVALLSEQVAREGLQGADSISRGPQAEKRKKKQVSFASVQEPASPPSSEALSSSDAESSEVSSSDSSDSDSDSDSSVASVIGDDDNVIATAPTSLQTSTTEQEAPLPITEVHPLEALYKRQRHVNGIEIPKPLQLDTTFSFFGGGGGDDEGGEEMDVDGKPLKVPLTPFTRRDREDRELRSAAPTPDTAFANKRFNFKVGGGGRSSDDEDESDSGEGEDSEEELSSDPDKTPIPPSTSSIAPPLPPPEKSGDPSSSITTTTAAPPAVKYSRPEKREESEFAKWFWEHRGENNRAWKKRRRDEMREKRRRENRRLARKVV